MKTCTGCGETKSPDEFTKDSKTKDGKARKCRVCGHADHARWLAANPGHGAAYQKRRRLDPAYHAKTNEAARLYAAQKRRAAGVRTREEKLEADRAAKAARNAQIEEVRCCSMCGESKPIIEFARWKDGVAGRVLQCRDCRSMLKNSWDEANEAWRALYAKAYNKAHPEERRTRVRKRRARLRNAPGEHHTAEEAQALWRAQGAVCANPYCFAIITHATRHLDHIMPLARGGSNAISNLQWLCARCNQQKGAKTPDEWWAWLARKHRPVF